MPQPLAEWIDEEVTKLGDRESILEYFVSNYRRLLKIALMMVKNVDIAQDVLHNVAVVILKKQGELDDVEHYGSYLALCIRRAALNYFRRAARTVATDPDTLSEILFHPDSESAYEYVEWIVALNQQLEGFAPEMRQAFTDHYLDDIPVESLAASLGITPNALSLRFKRMRMSLAEHAPSMLRHMRILSLL